MKKIISIVLAVLMLTALVAFPVSAADPLGTVVEAKYSKTAPNMADGVIDDSWGEKVAHIDKKSPNAGITQYSDPHDGTGLFIPETTSFDAYMRWTDDTLYLCFSSHDDCYIGDVDAARGDGFQFDAVYGVTDISHYSSALASEKAEYEFGYTYLINVDVDDYSSSAYYAAADIEFSLFWNEKEKTKVGKLAIPFANLGLGKKEAAKDGDYISFVMLCIEAMDGDPTGYTGWLEWGDFFNAEKGIPAPAGQEELYYVPASMNTKTSTANTIKLVGKADGETETPATPETPETPAEKPTVTEDPTPLKGAPSTWAEAEVKNAIEAGLVPEELQDNYTSGISRGELSKILSALLDKVYGNAPEKSDAQFNDTTDADVLKAANLGIINGYKQADGSYDFKPENTLKRSEMTAIINRVAKLCGKETTGFESEVTFTDTASHWCNKELGWAVHNGIVKGTSATTFSPENTLTIEQTIMMIVRTFDALK